MKSSRRSIIWIGFVVFLAMGIAYALEFCTAAIHFPNPTIFRTLGLIAVGLITFYGFLWYGTTQHGLINESDLRTAITISLVSVYLVLVGVVVFYPPMSKDANIELPAISTTLITSFTGLVGIVVPFYFGASAYVQAKREGTQKDSAPASAEDAAKRE